jgi:hypothetical protein
VRVIIAGPRDLDVHTDTIATAILDSPFTPSAVVCGGAKGVDAAAETFAHRYSIQPVVLRPLWSTLGKRAGPVRNEFMAQIGEALLVIKRKGIDTPGTSNMIKQAKLADLPIHIYEVSE